MVIIVPCAGKSTRYPNMRPKWMLTLPNGELMVKKSVSGLRMREEDRLVITILDEHERDYKIKKGLKESFKRDIDICVLKYPTKSQPETVYKTIKDKKIKTNEPILIKDSDNYFEMSNLNQKYSYVTVTSLNNYSDINPRNKSYVKINENGIIEDIVEKRVVSDLFSIGGYFFKHAGDFVYGFDKLSRISGKEFYISDIISFLISKGNVFITKEGKNYIDWGTIKEWNNYKLNRKTFIIDLDGVLVKNSARYFKPYWGTTKPIVENVDIVNALKERGNQVIIMTTRTEDYRAITEKQLKKIGLKYDLLIMNAMHNQRVLINDFSSSNPYPSALAINTERDTDQFSRIVRDTQIITWNG